MVSRVETSVDEWTWSAQVAYACACGAYGSVTRWRWVETLFGGLDRVYQAHNLVGRLAMSLLVLHGGILVFQALPDRALLGIYLLPGVDWGYTCLLYTSPSPRD